MPARCPRSWTQRLVLAGLVVVAGSIAGSFSAAAWAQDGAEAPVAGAADGSAPEGAPPVAEPTPPGTPLPEDPPEHDGPTGEAGAVPADETNGLIALFRTDAPAQAPVVLVLAGAEGRAEITLNDSGTAPDVTAGDGIWAGLAESAPLSGTVEVQVGGDTLQGGTVAWDADDRARELKVRIRGGEVEVRAATHVQPPTPPTEPPAEGDPPVQTGPARSSPGGPGGPSGPVAAPEGGTDWLGGVALVVALAALGMVLLRRPAEPDASEAEAVAAPTPSSAAAPPLPARLPEAGLLGPRTPSPSGGLSIWTGPPATLKPLLLALLQVPPLAPTLRLG